MKPRVITILILAMAFTACATSEQTARKNVFTFNYSDQTFEIISINTSSGEGVNILSQLGEDGDLFTAQDINQDGIIDVVIKGNTRLEDANLIYAAGINEARQSGNYHERNPQRSFKWENESYTLTISSYYFSEQDVNNLFTVMLTEDYSESIFMDYNADGTLDTVQKGIFPIQRAQHLYESTLLKGVDERRITKNVFNYSVNETRLLSHLEK